MKIFLTLDETSPIALANGVERDAVPSFLSFFNEAGLRDVVMLDVVSVFVELATLISCNHISDSSDGANIYKVIQENYSQNNPEVKAWLE